MHTHQQKSNNVFFLVLKKIPWTPALPVTGNIGQNTILIFQVNFKIYLNLNKLFKF
jgi:hypothetical protein